MGQSPPPGHRRGVDDCKRQQTASAITNWMSLHMTGLHLMS